MNGVVDRLPPTVWWGVQKLTIRRRGWTSVALCDDAEEVFWTYTVGFEATLNHPEIVIANCGPRTTERLFGLAHRCLSNRELIIRDGEPWDVCGQPRMVWRQVDRSRITTDWFAMAMRHRWERGLDPNGLRVFQLVLTGFSGHLPWEPGYLEEERAVTAELWRPA